MKEVKTEIIILVGPPCSGKSAFAKTLIKKDNSYLRVNRDELRTMLKGRFILDNQTEKLINYLTNNIILQAEINDRNVIVDATHCKFKYIEQLLQKYPECKFIIKFFEVPLWKLKVRNIIRYIRTGVWIPNKVIVDMNHNYEYVRDNFTKLVAPYIHRIIKVQR